ncbi:MAG: nucleoside phosphorylase [Bacillota bacterium]|nr:nucleoside phosphorylase [Bacillota bacterium]
MTVSTVEVQKHIRCKPGDVARYVLVPGDPGRARRIAQRFDEARLIAENREYVVFTGSYKGVPVSVCSTGIGGPSASIAIEELIRAGADTFIRVGSAGARQPDIGIGEVIVVTGAYRGDGTSAEYVPPPYPAIADLDVTQALCEAVRRSGRVLRKGISYTRDAYYVRDERLARLLTDAGVVCSEQECATLFIVASVRKARAGAVVGTDSNIWLAEQPSLSEKEALFKAAEQAEIEIALEAVRLLCETVDKPSSPH